MGSIVLRILFVAAGIGIALAVTGTDPNASPRAGATPALIGAGIGFVVFSVLQAVIGRRRRDAPQSSKSDTGRSGNWDGDVGGGSDGSGE